MVIVLNILIVLFTFIVMEFVAWATHKYVMHGFLWNLHKDHHVVDKNRFYKRMITFLIFAIPSIILIYYGLANLSIGFFIGLGILFYGIAYFVVHEIIIHRRLPPPKKLKADILKL